MPTYPWSLAVADELVSNLRPLRIDVEPEYFELTTLRQRLIKQGEQWDLAWSPQDNSLSRPGRGPLPARPRHGVRGTVQRSEPEADAAARIKALVKLEADLMRNDPPVAVWADFTPLAFVSTRFGCWGADVRLDLARVCKK